jgi:hypothetical protein
MGLYNNDRLSFCETTNMTQYSIEERKLLYRVLHQQLISNPELMDSQFLHELQTNLQKIAQAEGVDIGDHGAWDEWLGNQAVPCDVRVANRRVIS